MRDRQSNIIKIAAHKTIDAIRRRQAMASLAMLLIALAGVGLISPAEQPTPRQENCRPADRAQSEPVPAPPHTSHWQVGRRVLPAPPPPRADQDALRAAADELADPAQAAARLRGSASFRVDKAPVRLCQALGPAAPYNIRAIDSLCCPGHCAEAWEQARIINWQSYAQGEYVGHERLAHVDEYRLRVDDSLDLVYRITREETPDPYRLNVGDEIRVESFTDPALNRDLIIQPDGTITLRLLGQVKATGRTVPQLREEIEEHYKKYYKVPAITVSPLQVNSKLEDLRASVDSRYGTGGQNRLAVVTPEGTISLPVLGSVPAQGLTLTELQRELNERYRQAGFEGIEVIPSLIERAPRYVYVLGEVATPGRFEMTGPTTLLQALAMAGSWNVGAHLKQVVVFRRGDDWRLMATMVDLQKALFGEDPCPWGEIWLSDSDVIIVPKSPILAAGDFIDLVFTRGIYGVFPLSSTINFAKLSSL